MTTILPADKFESLYRYIATRHYNAVTPHKEWSKENLEMDIKREMEHFDDFVNALKASAKDQPITRDIFIIGHAMWMSEGVIQDGIFLSEKEVCDAIDTTFPSTERDRQTIEHFISCYLAQKDL